MYEIIHLKKGDRFTEVGEYVVLSGILACNVSQHLVKFISQGDMFICDSYFSNGAVVYESKQDTKLGKLIQQDSILYSKRRERQKNEITQLLLDRIDLLVLPTRERIMVFLFQLANQIGTVHEEDCHIPRVLTQVEFSKHVNCSREYLFGIRKILIEENWILKSREWVLLNWNNWEKGMERIAEDSEFK
ncbi:hypothetical protein PGRAN_09726 [Listeria grandensis FSL F6-0971]|uniref:Crp/Fnr family transcriptional regulator n=1 Tax=Listeria grandensis FSL F6-0971 TaxID=1265819 RepID=W7BEF4_9LIST|nr:Crp/Fnr family transcriptional regulator [Listeria grandensis]EUJ23200.1 hypothetical protein PGRAN_09726 [Listeria grandensis FSL F6-0971]